MKKRNTAISAPNNRGWAYWMAKTKFIFIMAKLDTHSVVAILYSYNIMGFHTVGLWRTLEY
jgi:hypothetical protein